MNGARSALGVNVRVLTHSKIHGPATGATQINEFVQAGPMHRQHNLVMSRQTVQIDLEKHPSLCFRIDNFFVPDAARAEFEAQMRQNQAFLETLPGFQGHVVFEKTGGPTSFNIVTIAVWESPEALEKAGLDVRAHYQKVGFDMSATLARWGVKAELGNFSAPRGLQ